MVAPLIKTQQYKLSLVYPQAFPFSREENLVTDLTRLADFFPLDSIEISTISNLSIRKDAKSILQNSFEEVIFLAGLPAFRKLAYLNASGAERIKAVEYTKTLLEEANELGANAFLVVSGPDVTSSHRQESMLNLRNSLIELLTFSKENFPQIKIRLEHTDRDVHRRQLIGPTLDSLRLINQIENEGLKLELNLDMSHILQLGEEIETTLGLAKDYCSHFHFSNCVLKDRLHPLYGDLHVPFDYPNSEVSFENLVQTLQYLSGFGYLEASHSTTLGLEVVPLADNDPWRTLEATIDVFNRARDEAFFL